MAIGLATVALIILFVSGATAQPAREPTEGVTNGNDITRPLHRIDLFANYTRPGEGINTSTATLRYERPFHLDESSKLALRFELPFVRSNETSPDNPGGNYQSGLGDILLQAVYSRKIDSENGFGFGLRILAPSASQPELGNQQWRMLPMVGVRFGLPGISPGSYFQPLIRYQFDFAGDPSRKHASDLQFSPALNVALPNDWYVTFFPSPDIRYSFVNQEWFVPFNVEVGKEWSKNLVTSIELGVPLTNGDHPVYRFKLEGRVGMRF